MAYDERDTENALAELLLGSGVDPTGRVEDIVNVVQEQGIYWEFRGLRMDWQDKGSCYGLEDQHIFEEPRNDIEIIAAKAICEICKVQRECLIQGVNEDDRRGIWGGTTYEERKDMKFQWVGFDVRPQ